MKEKTKDERIKAEERRLTKIYGALNNDIVNNGLTEKFSQGENQEPYDRKRPVADLYSSLNTSYQKIIKQLTDLLPAEEKQELDEMMSFISGGGAK